MSFLAGRKLRASELDALESMDTSLDSRLDALEARLVLRTTPTTTPSATWNSSARIVTHVNGTFTAVNGATYKVTIRANVVQTTAAAWCTAGIAVHQGGAVVAGDVPISAVTQLAESAGSIRNCSHSETFVASASGTYGVAIVGWIALGGGVGGLHATAVTGGFTNGLIVERVA